MSQSQKAPPPRQPGAQAADAKPTAPRQPAAPRAPAPAAAKPTALDERLDDVTVPITVVVGRKKVTLRELASWRGDTLVALEQGADEPLQIHVNGTCVATAELCEGEGGEGSLAIRILDVGSAAP